MTDKSKTITKDFFLWIGAMIAFYAGIVSFIGLLFNYISYAFPDPLQYYPNPYDSGIPYQMASLIILAPVFLALMRIIRSMIQKEHARAEIWVRRWALYLLVFSAGVTIVVDLIILITSFLGGEALTTAFLLKVLVVFLVAGAGLLHFLADIRGYWEKNASKAKMVNYGVGILVIATILSGFFIVGTPHDARLARYDIERTNDLSNIQWQIINFWQSKERIPIELAELNDSLSGFEVPADPETGDAYGYEKTGALTFTLCATFSKDSYMYGENTAVRPKIGGEDTSWEHGVGEVCFDRKIDPELYPVRDASLR